ncbi:MAG: hypothetical protein ACLFUZ_02890 [Candidatus Micrarchaeia archaeon]
MVNKHGGNGGNRNGNPPMGKGPNGGKQIFRKKHLKSIPGGKQPSTQEPEFRMHLQKKIEGLKREANVLNRENEQANEMLSAMEPQIQEVTEILQNQLEYIENLQVRLEAPLSTEERKELEKELDTCYHHAHKSFEVLDQKISEYNMLNTQADLTEERLQAISSRIALLEQHLISAGGPVSPVEKAEAEPGENPESSNNCHQPSFGVSAEEEWYAMQARARRAEVEEQARSGEEPRKKKTGKYEDYIPAISAVNFLKSLSTHFANFVEKPVRHTLGLIFKGPGRMIKLGLLGIAGVAGVSGWSAGNKALNTPGAATWSGFGKDFWNSSVENLRAVRDTSLDAVHFLYNHAFEVSCGLGALWTATGIFQSTPSKKLSRASFGTAIMAISAAIMDMSHNATTGARNMLEVVDFSDSLKLASVSAGLFILSKLVPDMEMPEGRLGEVLKSVPGYIATGIAWPFRKLAKGINQGTAVAGRWIAWSARKLAERASSLVSGAFERPGSVPPTQEMPAHMAPTSEEAAECQEGGSGEGDPLPETEEVPRQNAGGVTMEPSGLEVVYEDEPPSRSGMMEIPLDEDE